MNFDRINLSSCKKVKDEADLPGNFSTVCGEYFIPSMNKTGFYKTNCFFSNNPDLRELFSSLLLKKIGFPVADILLAYDEETQDNGCISMSILKSGEYFLENNPLVELIAPNDLKKLKGLDKFIEHDLFFYSSKFNLTPEFLKERRKFLIQYAFISAFLGNDDIKTDNCQVIYNQNDGTARNPEYYDMGMSFSGPDTVSTNDIPRYFFCNQLDMELLQEIYDKYPSEVEEISKQIEISLNKNDVRELLNEEVFQGLNSETRKKIWMNLGKKITYISKQNELLYSFKHNQDSFLTSIEEVRETTKDADITLVEQAKSFINRLKTRLLGER